MKLTSDMAKKKKTRRIPKRPTALVTRLAATKGCKLNK